MTIAAAVGADDLLASMHVVALPMRVAFRGVRVREMALIEGPAGWGEFAPFVEYEPAEAARWLACAIESAYADWPPPVRPRVPVNATVPAVPAADVADILKRFDGCTTAKVKVAERGQTPAEDLDRVAAVRAALGPHGRIRVDANGGWDLEPCARAEDLRGLRIRLARKGIDVPIAADESIRKAEDPLRVARLEAADLIVVKVAPLGGVASALAIVAACGLPAVVSSALDSSVGISAGIALAAALPRLDHACGLGTVNLMSADVTGSPLVPVAGVLRPRRVAVDPGLLSRYAVAPERLAWWRERVRACAILLGRS